MRPSRPNATLARARALFVFVVHTMHMHTRRYASCERVSPAPIGYRSAGIDGGDDKGGAAGVGEGDRQGGGATETGVGGGASEEAGVSLVTASSVLDRVVTLLAALPAHTHTAEDDIRLPVSSPPQPLLLLGVFSGSAARRAAVRCTWAAHLGRAGGRAQRRRRTVAICGGCHHGRASR